MSGICNNQLISIFPLSQYLCGKQDTGMINKGLQLCSEEMRKKIQKKKFRSKERSRRMQDEVGLPKGLATNVAFYLFWIWCFVLVFETGSG